METLTYSNPRCSATIENWPSGQHRVTAQFRVEGNARGERAVRWTEYNGVPSGHKNLTYAKMARIVDGSDGRTYIAELTEYGHITIMRGDMKFSHESVFPRDARYPALFELFARDQVA